MLALAEAADSVVVPELLLCVSTSSVMPAQAAVLPLGLAVAGVSSLVAAQPAALLPCISQCTAWLCSDDASPH